MIIRFIAFLLILNVAALAFYLVIICKSKVKRIIIGSIISVFSLIVICGMIDMFFIDPYYYYYRGYLTQKMFLLYQMKIHFYTLSSYLQLQLFYYCCCG